MKYPAQIQITGQTIPVYVQDTPVAEVYRCDACGYNSPVYAGTAAVCRKCGHASLTPTEGIILGQYSCTNSYIRVYHSDETPTLCGINFFHEVLEAINSVNDLKLPHQTITTLAACWYQAMSSGNLISMN